MNLKWEVIFILIFGQVLCDSTNCKDIIFYTLSSNGLKYWKVNQNGKISCFIFWIFLLAKQLCLNICELYLVWNKQTKRLLIYFTCINVKKLHKKFLSFSQYLFVFVFSLSLSVSFFFIFLPSVQFWFSVFLSFFLYTI